MPKPEKLPGNAILYCGDCLQSLKSLKSNSIDSVVTDPPYHLVSIVKRFGADNAAPAKSGKTGAYKRHSTGFMGKSWDGGDIAFQVDLWKEVYRVMKPGAHLLSFGGTRTYHRMACAIEDTGFEIRDMISWVYGSGFPKSHSVPISIDKAAGIKPRSKAFNMKGKGERAEELEENGRHFLPSYKPVTKEAKQWDGWGTGLKPSNEPIVLARKPLSEKTIAANVLRWGTGALNIDGCRIETDGGSPAAERRKTAIRTGNTPGRPGEYGYTIKDRRTPETYIENRPGEEIGRWPANLIHDGSEKVMNAFPENNTKGHFPKNTGGIGTDSGIYGKVSGNGRVQKETWIEGTGSVSRYFYSPKADGDDRFASKHPTVKPVNLIQYLVRLITPPGGTVLDPFAGTGTTGEAAFRERVCSILMEREKEYQDDIRRRMKFAMKNRDERKHEITKATGVLAKEMKQFNDTWFGGDK